MKASGKNFIKIAGVGMGGTANSNETRYTGIRASTVRPILLHLVYLKTRLHHLKFYLERKWQLI